MRRLIHGIPATAALVLADLSALVVAYLLAYAVRHDLLARLSPRLIPPLPLRSIMGRSFLVSAAAVVAIFAFEKLYTRRFSFWEEIRRVVKGVSLASLLIMTTAFAAKASPLFSRVVLIAAWPLACALIPLFRRLAKAALTRAGLWTRPVLILGTGRMARLAAVEIGRDPSLGYRVAGFLSEAGPAPDASGPGGLEIVGKMPEALSLAGRMGVRDFVLALPAELQDRLPGMAKAIEAAAETITIVPPFGAIFTSGVESAPWGDVITLALSRSLAKPGNILLKRTLDIALTTVLIVLVSPLLLVAAAAIAADSRGPVFFTQWRLGQGGRPFRILKFRSMHQGSEGRLEEVLNGSASAAREWGRFRKIKGPDPRVTRVGRVLRAWSLDELPQLFNILRGDMSLVGPRPYLPEEKDLMGESFPAIALVRPGITGLWQVRGRNLLTFDDRLVLDESYVRNWSLWLDAVILAKTFRALAKREGAF